MKRIETELPGVVILEPVVYSDARGFFLETWNKARYLECGVAADFVQDNVSRSVRGVVRGLHYQNPHPQGKLIYVLEGEVLDVAVDIRVGSPTFGRWAGVALSSDNRRQVFVPQGFAHGFAVLSESALFAYKCTDFYNPKTEGGILWNDPDIGIDWRTASPILSDRDKRLPRLRDIPLEALPRYA
jgi:dTDP-4-dehydrorhamnose 3,5-epimerase